MNVPAKFSQTGNRFIVSGNTEEEVIENYILSIKVPESALTLEKYMYAVLMTYYFNEKVNSTFDRYEGIFQRHVKGTKIGKTPLIEVSKAE